MSKIVLNTAGTERLITAGNVELIQVMELLMLASNMLAQIYKNELINIYIYTIDIRRGVEEK